MVQQVSVKVAHNTMKMKSASVLNTNEAELISNQQEFYIFNHGNDQGFVIMAADDRVAPILGYSNQGSFDPNQMPPNMQKWLEGYKSAIRYAIENNIAASDE